MKQGAKRAKDSKARVKRVLSIYYNDRQHVWVASETCEDGTTINSYFKTQSEAQQFKKGSGLWVDEPCAGNKARAALFYFTKMRVKERAKASEE